MPQYHQMPMQQPYPVQMVQPEPSPIEKMLNETIKEHMQEFMKMMLSGKGWKGSSDNTTASGGNTAPQAAEQAMEEEPEPAIVDEAEIKKMEHRLEVVPKPCK